MPNFTAIDTVDSGMRKMCIINRSNYNIDTGTKKKMRGPFRES